MNDQFSLLHYADNWIVWAIPVLALFCYIVILNFLLGSKDSTWRVQFTHWRKLLPILLSALPLLGLLGTIAGLLSTFKSMSVSGGLDQQSLLSSGIADALITTQLGLVMVIPGLLLFSWLKSLYRQSLRKEEAHAR